MLKRLDLFLCFLGLGFIGLIAWDCYKSPSHLPEGLLYVIRRTPDSYPSEISQDVQKRTDSMAQDIRKQIAASKTGCISVVGLPNALCIGPMQVASPVPSVEPSTESSAEASVQP